MMFILVGIQLGSEYITRCRMLMPLAHTRNRNRTYSDDGGNVFA